MRVFEQAKIGTATLRNRVIRSATFEGMCDSNGAPTPGYLELYEGLARCEVGALISGFAFVSDEGRAMHPGQAGMHSDSTIAPFRRVTDAVHRHGCPMFLQLAHAGRQTVEAATHGPVRGASSRRSWYFRSRPQPLTTSEVRQVVDAFGRAARRAKEAGFDGVQLHCAHGYLIHQFLDPALNDRWDNFGVDPETGLGTAFLQDVIRRVRALCGADYPVLVKISAGDHRTGAAMQQFDALLRFLNGQPINAVEISYGTMDRPFNIFRGSSMPTALVMRYNPRFRTEQPVRRWLRQELLLPVLSRGYAGFTPGYNLTHAITAKLRIQTPVICVGGFRTGEEIRRAIELEGIDFVSLSRPFLREPDLVVRLKSDPGFQSRCENCNRCAVMCDSGHPTRCYRRAAAARLNLEPEHAFPN